MDIVEEDLLKTFCKLFSLQFCISSGQCKNVVWQRFDQLYETHFHMKIIPTDYNSYKFS